MISEVDLLLETTIALPENRTGRSRELLRAALAITDDLISENSKADQSHAAALGRKGGSTTANKFGPEHYRRMAAARKTRGGGRPKIN